MPKSSAKANQRSFDLNNFENNIITPHDAGLNENEIKFLNEHSDNKFFETYESNVRRVFDHQNEINNRTNEIRNTMNSEGFKPSSLSQEQRQFLQTHHAEFYNNFQRQENEMLQETQARKSK